MGLMQCALWCAEAHALIQASLDTKLPTWRRDGMRANARRFADDANKVSTQLFGRNASDLI
jgi:hypothetical protein